jgi:hypothetical protein
VTFNDILKYMFFCIPVWESLSSYNRQIIILGRDALSLGE